VQALVDSNQRLHIREKMHEFSSTLLSTLYPYLLQLLITPLQRQNKVLHASTFKLHTCTHTHMHTHTHTHLMALFPGLPGWAGTRKVKPIWILLKQEIESGSGISWATCKSAPLSRQITMPAPHHSVFFTGRVPFLLPNQQRQSTEGKKLHTYNE